MTKVSEVYGGGQLLKAADLKGKGPVRVTIASVEPVSFSEDDKKLVLTFERASKKLALNRSNAETLAAAVGDESSLWSGVVIQLSTRQVMFKGQLVDSIVVEVPAQ